MEKQPIIAVKNLSVEYAKTPVFRKINFEILAGDFVCLVGCNGAGKTTLIKTILGLIEPSAGNVEFLGMSRKEIGYISQETIVTSNFPATVEEIVLSGLLNQKRGIFSFLEKNKAKVNVLVKYKDIDDEIDDEIIEETFRRAFGWAEAENLVGTSGGSDEEIIDFG